VQYKATLEVEEISSQEFVLKQLDTINNQLSEIRRSTGRDMNGVDGRDLMQLKLREEFLDFLLTRKGTLAGQGLHKIIYDFRTYLSTDERVDKMLLNATDKDVIKVVKSYYEKQETDPDAQELHSKMI
jgi:hypothetical protein